MGDVLSLIEKAEASVDEEKAREMSKKLSKGEMGFDDYLEYMQQIKNMGGLADIMNMMPGMGSQLKGAKLPDEKELDRVEAIIFSMTLKERTNPGLLNPSRKNRIAKGAGVDISEVNKLVKQFEMAKKMMKQMPNMMGGKGGRLGKFKMPF